MQRQDIAGRHASPPDPDHVMGHVTGRDGGWGNGPGLGWAYTGGGEVHLFLLILGPIPSVCLLAMPIIPLSRFSVFSLSLNACHAIASLNELIHAHLMIFFHDQHLSSDIINTIQTRILYDIMMMMMMMDGDENGWDGSESVTATWEQLSHPLLFCRCRCRHGMGKDACGGRYAVRGVQAGEWSQQQRGEGGKGGERERVGEPPPGNGSRGGSVVGEGLSGVQAYTLPTHLQPGTGRRGHEPTGTQGRSGFAGTAVQFCRHARGRQVWHKCAMRGMAPFSPFLPCVQQREKGRRWGSGVQ